jgi:hypothetical protein
MSAAPPAADAARNLRLLIGWLNLDVIVVSSSAQGCPRVSG